MKKINILFILIAIAFLNSCVAQSVEKKDTSEVRFLNTRKFYIYKVNKGETLFSISQKFNVPQEEILEFNSDVKANGLKAKMKLWIPAYSWLNKDSLAAAEKTEKKPIEVKRYKVAVITALNLPKLYLEKGPFDSSYVEEPVEKELAHNIDFVESVKYAFENSAKEGLKIDLSIIDDESDTLKIGRAIRGDLGLSAIITNETGPMLKLISAICQNRNIKLFSTGINTTETIRNNKYAVSLLPSSLTQCEMAGYFATEYFSNSTAVFIKTSSYKENERTDAFKQGWKARNQPFIQCDYTKEKVNAITDSLKKTKNAIIFIPSSNEDMVTTMLSVLKDKKDSGLAKFSVIGLPTWQSFETVDPKLMEQTDVYIFNSGHINFTAPEVTAFRKYFRDNFSSEPGEMALQGYDAAKMVSKALRENGGEIYNKDLREFKGLYTDYIFDFSNGGSSAENKVIHVFKTGNDETEDLAKKVQWK